MNKREWVLSGGTQILGQVKIDDSRAVLVSRFSKGEADFMESALLQRNPLRGSDEIQPSGKICVIQCLPASNTPAQLSCLNRALPLEYDILTIEISCPFTLPSRLKVRGQGKRPLPDLSPACRKEIRVKNKKEKHHPNHQSHCENQELVRIAIKNLPWDHTWNISDRGDK